MTDPEAKAREIVASLFPALTPVGVESFTRERAEVEAALREARSQALDEAAGVADAEFAESDNQVRTGVMPIAIRDGWTARRAGAEAIAARIRSLKEP